MKFSLKFLFCFILSIILFPFIAMTQENDSDISGSIATDNSLAVGDNTGLPQITQEQANEDAPIGNEEPDPKADSQNTSEAPKTDAPSPHTDTQASPNTNTPKETQEATAQQDTQPTNSQEQQTPSSNAESRPEKEAITPSSIDKKDPPATQTLITNPPSFFFNEVDENDLPLFNQYGFKRAPYKRVFFIKKEFHFQLRRTWRNPKVLWFFVHNSEGDAKITFEWAVTNIGGYGLSLINQGNPEKRDIRYFIRGIGTVELDPNRMFTQKGILQNLSLLNKSLMKSHSARRVYRATWRQVSKPSTRVLMRYWNKNRPLIALHNNRILTYEEFKNNPIYSTTTFPEYDNGTFIITNIRRYYFLLKKQHLNVILQKRLAHDGSLSDLAFLKKYPYINIETRMGNIELQKRVVYAVITTLFPAQITKPKPLVKKKRPIKIRKRKAKRVR